MNKAIIFFWDYGDDCAIIHVGNVVASQIPKIIPMANK